MKQKIKIILAILGLILVVVILQYVVVGGGLLALFSWAYEQSEIEENTDIALYNQFMGENANEEYRSKCGMDESIFPESITEDMSVQDYKMVYYNPWDPQYLSYLVVEYDEEQYQAEVKRLKQYPSEDYIGIYSAAGFDEKYELLAMNSDQYYGFVYALTDNQNTIIYVELIFCNYFMDLDYKEYIKEEYLPIGFDATLDNPYEQKMMGEQDTSFF